MSERSVELSVVIPCLNEAETVGVCVAKAVARMAARGIDGEVVVGDNGSTDGSAAIAEAAGARVVHVPSRGYGNALYHAIRASRGRYILMGDADDSYDFAQTDRFYDVLAEGHDLVMGCRLPAGGGTVAPGAMPWLHRWVGNPALTGVTRWLFGVPFHDVHCGMRAFTREAFEAMALKSGGMVFASEMVVRAAQEEMRVSEIPITLHPDGRRTATPHLRTWRDGWQHLWFLLSMAPRWLFGGPGWVLIGLGLGLGLAVAFRPLDLGAATLDVNTYLVAAVLVAVGHQAVVFSRLAERFGRHLGMVPKGRPRRVDVDREILLGLGLAFLGLGLVVWETAAWATGGFGPLDYSRSMRVLIPGGTALTVGVQTVFGGFFAGVLDVRFAEDGRDRAALHDPSEA